MHVVEGMFTACSKYCILHFYDLQNQDTTPQTFILVYVIVTVCV